MKTTNKGRCYIRHELAINTAGASAARYAHPLGELAMLFEIRRSK
jgi:hypothetical protein